MLDVQMLKAMPPGTKFATGLAMDAPGGLHLSRSGKKLRWVAIRGHGPLDWAIYAHFAEQDMHEIARSGDKVGFPDNIRMLVPCDDESLRYYRS